MEGQILVRVSKLKQNASATLCSLSLHFFKGSLSSDRLLDIEPETDFYLNEAKASKATFDLFVRSVEGETLGLAATKFLPLRTGLILFVFFLVVISSHTGGLLLNGFQPQDLYRLYKNQHAYSCEMIMRTSPDIAVSEDYQKDVKLLTCRYWSILFNLQSFQCFFSSRDSFSYDFEFTNSGGTYSDHILVQVAFAYTALIGKGKLQRFLRVITSRAKSSLSWRLVYPSTVPEVQLTLLSHKIARACFDEGVDEARMMLKGWIQKLANLCAENNVSLGVFQSLKDFPRFVFGLLQSPFLRSVISSDDFIITQVLLAKLPPRDVLCFVYPQLQSWSTFDKLQSKSIHLNLASSVATQCPILLLDTNSKIIVKSEKPVPKDSSLKNTIDKLRDLRIVGCDVVYDTTGSILESYLIEEHGYKEFLNELNVKKLQDKKRREKEYF